MPAPSMPQLGTKHECVECGTRFYDLGRSAAVCPGCGTDQHEALPDREPEDVSPESVEPEPPEDDELPEEDELPEDLGEDLFDEDFPGNEEEPLLDDF